LEISVQQPSSDAFLRVEQHGIDFIPETERWATPRSVAGLWAGASLNVEYVVYGAILATFGFSFGQTVVLIVIGNLSWLLVGLTSLQGPRAGTTTFGINRAPFGPNGSRAIALCNWLTQLGFADPHAPPPPVGGAQVTYLAIRDLPGPPLGADRSEYSQAERVGEQIVRLIAMLALHLVAAERDRLKLFSFDEGWRLLGDPIGRMLLASLQRMGRSERAVPIISTQLVSDALIGERESLENLIGATFVFGVRSQLEAARALALLGLDPEDRQMRRVLLSMDAGRCLFRDHRGRVEAIQVELLVPTLLEGLAPLPR